MAFRTLQVTLGAGATLLSRTRYPFRQLLIQNPVGNDTVYVGDSTVSFMVHYSDAIAAGVTRSIGPFSGSAPTNTDEYYLAGTENNVLHCILITH